MAKVLLFPASLRENSHHKGLVRHFAALLEGHCEIDILDASEVKLPLFNQDLEQTESVVSEVIALSDRFSCADGIIVASPEYNGHVSPYLKNTVDWVSRLSRIDKKYAGRNPFRDKPLLLTSASTGWTGGILGLQDARSIFAYLGCLVVQDQICLSHADSLVVDGKYQFSPRFSGYVSNTIDHFFELVRRCQPR